MIGLNMTRLDDPVPPEVTHLRIWDLGVHWGAIHLAPDRYEWDRLDVVVDRFQDRHLTYVISGTPKWLAKNPSSHHAAPWLGPGSNSVPFSIDEFNKFVWQLATRYAGRINAYEIWNEPQLADFLHPYNDATCNTLATMTKRAYNTIKRCDPKALVISGAVLPRESSGGMTRASRYLRALGRKGWPVDAFAVHIYPEVGKGVSRWKAMLTDATSSIKALRAPTTKVWITETAYGLLGDPIGDDQARQLVADTYTSAGGRFIYWYAWDRPDLGGMRVADGTAAWEQIKESGGTDG